jgi:hypothetical protein
MTALVLCVFFGRYWEKWKRNRSFSLLYIVKSSTRVPFLSSMSFYWLNQHWISSLYWFNCWKDDLNENIADEANDKSKGERLTLLKCDKRTDSCWGCLPIPILTTGRSSWRDSETELLNMTWEIFSQGMAT